MKDVEAQKGINGDKPESFKLKRSNRQGCSLAPSLFILASNALHYLLRNNNLSLKIKKKHFAQPRRAHQSAVCRWDCIFCQDGTTQYGFPSSHVEDFMPCLRG